MDLLAQVRDISIIQVATDLGYQLQFNRKILCPFHDENTASLVLYPQTNTFHCFGCGKHGDVVSFYADISKQEYRTAMHELAANYLPGYQIGGYKQKGLQKVAPERVRAKKIATPNAGTYVYRSYHSDIYEEFQRICDRQPAHQIGLDAIDYLQSRGFTEKTLRDFRIFVVTDYETVHAHLRNTFSLLDLQESGLYNERGNLIFYRHPIIIPYYRNGRIVFLQARVIGAPADTISRYQFLSGVPVELFNQDILPKLGPRNRVYVTEGAFDCMTLTQLGLHAVSLGSVTMFKREWAKLFRRVEVFFYFDNDDAGKKAAIEFSGTFTQHGISIHTQPRTVPDGYKDVNDYFTNRPKPDFL
ncbi:hypothetical protein GCM10023189_24400 [Nibrella saemangeumensis]|uniref:DNA primase n=1 Tax=Nibrella saemangeumensis TaxID=1084526 RepID=A0ABP8MX37_9BACT